MRLMLAGLFALVSLPALAQAVTPQEVVRGAVEDYIRPGFTALADAAGTMQAAMAGFCAAPSPAGLEAAREQFKAVVVAYAAIEFVRFGPMAEENRAERLYFWPDRKGIALKQVQGILIKQDQGAATTEGLMGKSVAVQGLGALEFVLFGTDSESLSTADGAFRCAYGTAIAGALAATSGALHAAWTDPEGIVARMENPSAEDPDYRDDTEVLEELTGAIAHGLEAVRDTRLMPVLANGDAPAKPKSAPFWRSEMSVASIAANFAGLEAFFERSQLGLAAGEKGTPILDAVAADFAKADQAFAVATDPIEAALADPAQAAALSALVAASSDLQQQIGEKLSRALGLSVGFSSLDGD